MTIKDVCEGIWAIEKEHDLFQKRIQKTYFWKLIRMGVFVELTKALGVFSDPHDALSRRTMMRRLPLLLLQNVLHGTSRRRRMPDCLVFENPRQVLLDGKLTDPYTYWLCDKLRETGQVFEVVETAYQGKYQHAATTERSYLDYLNLAGIIWSKLKKPIRFTAEEEDLLRRIEAAIESRFSVQLGIQQATRYGISSFERQLAYYDRLFSKRRPKHVYIVCSYGKEALVEACKRNLVECTEIQHGVMGRYHLGYSFPNNQEIPYFPERMLLFSRYWHESTPIPLGPQRVDYVGNPYMRKRLDAYHIIRKKDGMILFISQGTIGSRLSDIAVGLAERNPSLSIVYKLHPGEFLRWKDAYPALKAARDQNRISVVDGKTPDLYSLMAEACVAVGVNSTALYEALTMHCAVVVIKLPGFEYMEGLAAKGHVAMSAPGEDLAARIRDVLSAENDTIAPEFW